MKEYMEKYHVKDANKCVINPPQYASDSTEISIDECKDHSKEKDILYYDKKITLRINPGA